jgi:hypothetical protein
MYCAGILKMKDLHPNYLNLIEERAREKKRKEREQYLANILSQSRFADIESNSAAAAHAELHSSGHNSGYNSGAEDNNSSAMPVRGIKRAGVLVTMPASPTAAPMLRRRAQVGGAT